MICVIRAASAVAVFENVTPPPVRVSSPATRPVLILTGPGTPAAPSWMCPMLMCVVEGQPLIVTSNFAVVAVNVTVALPLQVASAPVMGGTSFADLSSALKVFAGDGDGDGDGV